jgi:hypothetical protein
VNEQVELVSQQLANVSELRNGFDAIGFSQGSCRLAREWTSELRCIPLV